ncbi:MAG: WGR domain-containing protein [Candidatus Competibacter sp.]|nr:WGR domain-containing protein [Candidatus Competibacter sp.]
MTIPIRLERREPARNRQRFYTIAVTRTLFDGWALVRGWGRIGQPGTVRETWFQTEAAATEAGAKVRQRKEQRGYYQKHKQQSGPMTNHLYYGDNLQVLREHIATESGKRPNAGKQEKLI